MFLLYALFMQHICKLACESLYVLCFNQFLLLTSPALEKNKSDNNNNNNNTTFV